MGRPKRFTNKEELMDLFLEFIEDIRDKDYNYIPSQTSFCVWLKKTGKMGADRKTIYTTVTRYFPDIKRKFNEIQAETMVEGGMVGEYAPAITIFALKNWFGYRDKTETEITGSIHQGIKNSQEVIDQIKARNEK